MKLKWDFLTLAVNFVVLGVIDLPVVAVPVIFRIGKCAEYGKHGGNEENFFHDLPLIF